MSTDAREVFARNLNTYMTRSGKTQADLQAYMRCSSSTVSDWCNGNKYPRPDKMQRISEFLGVLMSDLTSDKPISEFAPDIPAGCEPLPRMVRVPFLGEIACGAPLFANEERGLYAEVDPDIRADFCLRAKGDSMIGARIFDGDIVFIRQQDAVDNGEIAAVIIEDETTLKRVNYFPEKNLLILKAENSEYSDLVYSGEELNHIKILGKAVAFQSAVR